MVKEGELRALLTGQTPLEPQLVPVMSDEVRKIGPRTGSRRIADETHLGVQTLFG